MVDKSLTPTTGNDNTPGSTDDNPVWLRQDGEPGLWYQRFLTYRSLGPNRSIRKVYLANQRERGRLPEDQIKQLRLPKHWSDVAREWNWADRALAWDAHVNAELEAQFLERVTLEKDSRFARLAKMTDKWEEFLEALDPNIHEVKPHEIMKMGTLINQDSRAEFEEPLKQRRKDESAQIAGSVTFADLVKIAQHLTQPAPASVTDPGRETGDVVEGTFTEIPKNPQPEEKAGKIPEKIPEKYGENSPEIAGGLGTPTPTPAFSVDEEPAVDADDEGLFG
jgi:hypothetical protein